MSDIGHPASLKIFIIELRFRLSQHINIIPFPVNLFSFLVLSEVRMCSQLSLHSSLLFFVCIVDDWELSFLGWRLVLKHHVNVFGYWVVSLGSFAFFLFSSQMRGLTFPWVQLGVLGIVLRHLRGSFCLRWKQHFLTHNLAFTCAWGYTDIHLIDRALSCTVILSHSPSHWGSLLCCLRHCLSNDLLREGVLPILRQIPLGFVWIRWKDTFELVSVLIRFLLFLRFKSLICFANLQALLNILAQL